MFRSHRPPYGPVSLRRALMRRGIGGALLGAVLGLLIAVIYAWNAAMQSRCLTTSPSPCDDFAALGYAVETGGVGIIVTVAVCWIGWALVDLRPLTVSVSVGGLLTLCTVSGLENYNHGPPGPAWLVVVFAGVFAGFALAMTWIAHRFEQPPADPPH